MSELERLKDALRENAGLAEPVSAKAAGLCISCNEPALPKCYSEAGVREYGISGMCEECFDRCTQEDE